MILVPTRTTVVRGGERRRRAVYVRRGDRSGSTATTLTASWGRIVIVKRCTSSTKPSRGRMLTKAIRVMVRRLRKAQGANPRLVPKRISFMQNGRQVTRTQLVLPEQLEEPEATARTWAPSPRRSAAA